VAHLTNNKDAFLCILRYYCRSGLVQQYEQTLVQQYEQTLEEMLMAMIVNPDHCKWIRTR
jgi:hypothetical protein